MAKRYLLFAGERYYPAGGWRDCKMDFETIESAVSSAKGLEDDYDWWQVADLHTGAIVAEKPTAEQS
jgi:hypothetical protein